MQWVDLEHEAARDYEKHQVLSHPLKLSQNPTKPNKELGRYVVGNCWSHGCDSVDVLLADSVCMKATESFKHVRTPCQRWCLQYVLRDSTVCEVVNERLVAIPLATPFYTCCIWRGRFLRSGRAARSISIGGSGCSASDRVHGGSFTRGELLAVYAEVAVGRSLQTVLPSDFCLHANEQAADNPWFLLREQRGRYRFLGMDGQGDGDVAMPTLPTPTTSTIE